MMVIYGQRITFILPDGINGCKVYKIKEKYNKIELYDYLLIFIYYIIIYNK